MIVLLATAFYSA